VFSTAWAFVLPGRFQFGSKLGSATSIFKIFHGLNTGVRSRHIGPSDAVRASVLSDNRAHWCCHAETRVTRPSLQLLDDLRQMPLNNVVHCPRRSCTGFDAGQTSGRRRRAFRTQGPTPPLQVILL
jgi:hypothetical protein